MSTVNVGALQSNTSRVLEDLAEGGEPILVLRSGRPVAALYPVDEQRLEDYVFATAPEFVQAMDDADGAIARGEHGIALSELVAGLDS